MIHLHKFKHCSSDLNMDSNLTGASKYEDKYVTTESLILLFEGISEYLKEILQ